MRLLLVPRSKSEFGDFDKLTSRCLVLSAERATGIGTHLTVQFHQLDAQSDRAAGQNNVQIDVTADK